MELTLNIAEKIIAAAQKEARRINIPMVIAVVDESGKLICFKKMDGALQISIELAPNKAYSSVVLEMATDKIGELALPEGELYGIENTCDNIVTFGGGMPILCGDKVIGGLGVSGGSVQQDIQVAQAGIDFFRERFTSTI